MEVADAAATSEFSECSAVYVLYYMYIPDRFLARKSLGWVTSINVMT